MTAAPQPVEWETVNQRALTADLERLREALRRHARGEPQGPADDGTGVNGSEPNALPTLCAAFGLSPFERDVVLLCAGVELDASFAAAVADARGERAHHDATFGLALAALPGAHWSALSPGRPLRRWRLVELAGESASTSPLRIAERVLHFLTGTPSLEERLEGLVEPLAVPASPAPSRAALAGRIAALWTRGEGLPPVIQLCGRDRAGARAVAAAACSELGLTAVALRSANVPASAPERAALARLWEREAALGSAALLVECEDGEEPERTRAALALVDEVEGIRLLSARDPIPSGTRALVRADVPELTEVERRELWRAALGPLAEDLAGELDAAVRQFELGERSIEAASAAVRLGTPPWEASRAQARPRLDDLAQRIEPAAGWDDLVLAELQRQMLTEIVIHVLRRRTVYDDWGFASKGSRGLGIAALFAGASGTGKTMAAEVLAGELRLDLYRIDLSSVVSKYIGETEKNLRRVFDAAEEGGAILLFDEADALFGKRSEVKDSHDRYANIEVSYLLQRMESYRGLAILTTNQRSALDPSFLRRIRFVIHFPFPDPALRAQIWRRIYPAETPTEGLDAERLAQLNVAGGNIRSIALNAAFLAADEDGSVRMEHLLRAARSEYVKLEKPLSEREIGGWT